MSVYSETPSAVSDDMRNNNPLDFEHMTYAEVKSQALENILNLENPATPPQYRVSRQHNYQEVLNALAADIRSKHRRRLERQRESAWASRTGSAWKRTGRPDKARVCGWPVAASARARNSARKAAITSASVRRLPLMSRDSCSKGVPRTLLSARM